MKKLITYFLACAILLSCSTSNQVVSNKIFQKRKYKKGWYINSSKSIEKEKRGKQVEFVAKSHGVKKDSTLEPEKEPQVNDKKKITSIQQSREQLASYEKPVPLKQLKKVKSRVFNHIREIKTSINPPEISETDNPTPDRSDETVRILLAILGILFLFTTITPLAVLIGIGRGEALRINTILYLITLACAVVLIAAAIAAIASGAEILVIIVGLITLGMFFVSVGHALFSIIRGY